MMMKQRDLQKYSNKTEKITFSKKSNVITHMIICIFSMLELLYTILNLRIQ